MPIQKIAILGPGLLGGSLGYSCRDRYDVHFWGRSEEKLAPVREQGFRATTEVAEVIEGADLIVMAIPVPYMRGMVEQLIEAGLRQDQLVTDVGSVKGSLIHEVQPLLGAQGYSFIGSHPMAGAEKQGFAAASRDLLPGASCIVTPDQYTCEEQLQTLLSFWQELGMQSYELPAEEHDDVIARVSHVPHVLASVCAHVALPQARDGQYAGGGLRDTSRVASGDARLWAGILSENNEAVAGYLEEAIVRLQSYQQAVKSNDLDAIEALLNEDKERRDAYYSQT